MDDVLDLDLDDLLPEPGLREMHRRRVDLPIDVVINARWAKICLHEDTEDTEDTERAAAFDRYNECRSAASMRRRERPGLPAEPNHRVPT